MKQICRAFNISIFLIFVSCGNSVEDMVKEYNGDFTETSMTVSSEKSEKVLEPGDDGFSQSMLLRDDYTVYSNATLNLAAPASCTSFRWILTDPESATPDEPVSLTYFGETVSRTVKISRDFVFYVPESNLEIPHTYKLKLTVVGKDGGTYSDTCLIYIVKYYYINN